MCGIAGILSFDDRPFDAQWLVAMTDALRHRGPDDEGFVFVEQPSGAVREDSRLSVEARPPRASVGLGHRRLSIIDISPSGHQPMASDDRSLWIVYNGELYNYIALRRDLQALGHVFRTGTDTEVVLKAFETWGEECLQRFDGMWAFAVWDTTRRRLFCARDRLGEKPFYYYADSRQFVFASEPKAFAMHPEVPWRPNDRTIYTYLAHDRGYADTGDETFFEGIRSLPCGAYLVVEAGRVAVRRYWWLDVGEEAPPADERTLIDQFRHLLTDTIKSRMVADVPVGVHLSGGLDSSSVATLASRLYGSGTGASGNGAGRLSAYTLSNPEEPFSDEPYAKAVARENPIHHVMVRLDPGSFLSQIDKIIWHFDEPFKNITPYAQWRIYQDVVQHESKVLLSGHGGDEMLNAYPRQQYLWFADLLASGRLVQLKREAGAFASLYGLPLRKVLADTARAMAVLSLPPSVHRRLKRGYRLNPVLNADFARACASSYVQRLPGGRGFSAQDCLDNYFRHPVPHFVRLEDRASMAFSIEARSPLLRPALVEFAVRLPARLKNRGGVSKYIFREAVRGTVAGEVVDRTVKQGFPTPTEQWFRTHLKDWARDILTSREFKSRPYLNAAMVEEKFQRHQRGEENLRITMWSWINLELWFRTFLDRRPVSDPFSAGAPSVGVQVRGASSAGA